MGIPPLIGLTLLLAISWFVPVPELLLVLLALVPLFDGTFPSIEYSYYPYIGC
jgi:hypothetical protein